MVTSLLIQNKSLPNPILFKGIGYSVVIPGRAVDFTCQIPTENALEDIAILLNNVPSLEISIIEDGEGIPIPLPDPPPDVRPYIGDYTPVVLKDENYKGVWDASSGSAPHLTPEVGWYWRVSVSGTYELDGIDSWLKDDFVKWTGTLWMKAVGLAGYQYLFEALRDGDKLGIDWTPQKYTPEKVDETDNSSQLAAHLKGIDEELQKIPTEIITEYTQSEIDLADAVEKKHSHENKSVLDEYTQSETDLADAVDKKHDHENILSLAQVSGENTGDQDLAPYALQEDVEQALGGKSDSDHGHADATEEAPGFMSETDKEKLDDIEANADVTDAGNIGSAIHGAEEKTSIADADEFPTIDSEDSDTLKITTWSRIKSTLKSYFDGLYNNYVHPNHSGDVTSSGDGAQTIANKAVTLGKMADMATGSFLGRHTTETGSPEVLSAETALAMLGIGSGLSATEDTETTTLYPVMVAAAGSSQTPKVRTTATALSYNASSGILSAAGFSGPLTGNVTGNCSGSSGSCTGNAATASSCSGNAATATNATNHIAATTGAEHGATNANTANMIVRRDASGNFSAGTITASLTGNCSGSSGSCTGNAATASSCSGNAATSSSCSGNAATATTATNLSGGTVAATSITATGNITAYYSDARLKDFQGTIPDALAKVLSLNGYYFIENATAKALGCNNDRRQVGLSAQEVELVLPEVVTDSPIENDQCYKTLWYEKMIPLLIEAIKEQQGQIEELRALTK